MSDNIDILLKLFETLKDSSDKNENATQQLIVQQLELVGHIKHLPIEDLRQALKDHAKEADISIDACSETIENTTGDLMKVIQNMSSRVNKMIIVVVVAFTVLATAYGIVKTMGDSDSKFDTWKEKIDIEQEEARHKIANELIEELRKEMRRLHSKDATEEN